MASQSTQSKQFNAVTVSSISDVSNLSISFSIFYIFFFHNTKFRTLSRFPRTLFGIPVSGGVINVRWKSFPFRVSNFFLVHIQRSSLAFPSRKPTHGRQQQLFFGRLLFRFSISFRIRRTGTARNRARQ